MSEAYQAFHHTKERISSPLSGEGYTLVPQEKVPIIEPDSPIYKSMHIPWNTMEFLNKRNSINIGETSEKEAFNIPRINELHIYNMPIKIPGSLQYNIPKELEEFKQTLQMIINYQSTIKENILEDYCYITVDQSWVFPGDAQRKTGVHIDDMQGPRYPVKLPPNQTYIVSNAIPTKIYSQSFNFYDFNPDEYDLLPLIQNQANEDNVFELIPFSINLYDSYTAHSSNINKTQHKIWRTLVRVEFTRKIGDEISNTRNPLLADMLQDWVYQKRDKPTNLKIPEL
jgi:hypothetical protein